MLRRLLEPLGLALLVGACTLSACGRADGTRAGEGTESTVEALWSTPPDLQLQVSTVACDKDHVDELFEITNKGTTPVPLSAITIELWADDSSGHRLEPFVTNPGHVEGDPFCDRDVWFVQSTAQSFSPACGPDPSHQANWQVTISDADGALLAPGATWKDVGIDLHLDGLHDFSPGTADWYSGCQSKTYQFTSSYAVYVAGKLVTSSTGVPPSCKAAHGSQQLPPGHVAGGQGNVPIVGPLAADTQLAIGVSLPLTNQAALQTFLQNLYDPTSPQYRKYLTPAQYGAAYGASQADYNALTSYIQSSGLTVFKTFASRTHMVVTGTAAAVEAAFFVTLNEYQRPDGTTYFAAANEPSVNLTAPLLHISGMESATVPVPADLSGGTGPFKCTPTGNLLNDVESYVGTDFNKIYFPCNAALPTPLDGTGQTVALFELDATYPTELAAYVSPSLGGFPGLPANPNVTVEIVGPDAAPPMPSLSGNCSAAPVDNHQTASGVTPTPAPGNCATSGPLSTGLTTSPYQSAPGLIDAQSESEVALDVEMVVSMAPGARVIIYEQNRVAGSFLYDSMLEQMADDNSAKTISSSWYWYSHLGFSQAVANSFLQFAAQGQSFFEASMDLGAYVPDSPLPNVPDPMIDSVLITTVGGTQLTTTGTAQAGTLAYASETTWNDPTQRQSTSGCVDAYPYLDSSGNWAACNSVSGGGFASGYTRTNSDNTTSTWPTLPLPSYQAHLPTAYGSTTLAGNPQLGTTARMIPDVAMIADAITTLHTALVESNPTTVTNGGSTYTADATYTVFSPLYGPCMGGTSAGAPLWAAVMALENQQLQSAGQPPVGFANPTLYALASTSGASYQSAFHDIADGSDNTYPGNPDYPCTTPGDPSCIYNALPGYDLTTGLGSPACGILGQQCITCGGAGCVTLDTDSNNCGACGHTCFGGACVAGACQPVVLLDNVNDPVTIAVDSQNVYFNYVTGFGAVTKTGQLLGQYSTGTGAQLQSVGGITTDGANAFFTVWNGLVDEWSPSFDISTLYQQPLPGDTSGIAYNLWQGIAAVGANLYWIQNFETPTFTSAILSAPKAGGSSPAVVYSTNLPQCTANCTALEWLVGDANGMFWAERGATGTVMHSDVGFTSPAAYPIPAQPWINGFGIDATYVYWTTENFASDGFTLINASVWRIGRDGTGLTQLATIPDAYDMAVDSSGIYVTYGETAIYSIPLAGGAPAIFASNGIGATYGIATDATSVYWADENGRIMRQAK